jgi:dipeptidase D
MLNTIEPKDLWKNFSDLNAVPRPSKKEERVIEFMLNFGKQLGLPTQRDEIGNVIIKKPASKGMEGRATVCLQSHLDMVHQKNSDTQFDFSTQGIDMFVDGDWVRARGTTLGADNGLGVASIMTILASTTIEHPAIEALFTIDEETGMTGALNLKGGLLTAKYLLNLDTEDDHELTIGCAGGIDVTANGTYTEEKPQSDTTSFKVSVKGLTGGHSGMDIQLGRGNANKLMNRILLSASEQFSLRISSINGGSLRNAIPRESLAELSVLTKEAEAFKTFITSQATEIVSEYTVTDSQLVIACETINTLNTVMETTAQYRLLRSIYACPNGIYRMSPDVDRLVQSSNNLARVIVKDGQITIQCLTRSSVNSEKMDVAMAIKSCFELCGTQVTFSGAYPGWTPRPTSEIVSYMSSLYKKLFGHEAHVNAVHAGLECGILGTNYPTMQMISFGPNIRGAHSPDECAQISSVQKYWGYLLETLKAIPA